MGDEELRVGREPGFAAQLFGGVAPHHFHDGAAQPEHGRQPDQQQGGGGQVLALGHLALFPRLLTAVRSCILRFVAVGFRHRER